MSMTTTGAPLNLSTPAAKDIPGWVADFAGNARKENEFAKKMKTEIGDITALTTTAKENLVAALNELQAYQSGTLDTMEEVNANTRNMVPAGALALKEAVANLVTTIDGVDTALKASIDELNRKTNLGEAVTSKNCLNTNALVNSGRYWCNFSGIPNRPSDTNLFGVLEVEKISDGVILQRFSVYSAGNIYNRFYANGEWSPWRVIKPAL